jgi:hypothetical protein
MRGLTVAAKHMHVKSERKVGRRGMWWSLATWFQVFDPAKPVVGCFCHVQATLE